MDKLELSNTDRMFLGVCGGIGEYTNSDPTTWRIGLIFATLMFPFLIVGYFIFALVMPRKSSNNI